MFNAAYHITFREKYQEKKTRKCTRIINLHIAVHEVFFIFVSMVECLSSINVYVSAYRYIFSV